METLRMVSSMVSPNMEYVLCVPPMVCGLQLLAAIRFSFFVLGRGVWERLVYHSPLPGVGKPTMVVVRVPENPICDCLKCLTRSRDIPQMDRFAVVCCDKSRLYLVQFYDFD